MHHTIEYFVCLIHHIYDFGLLLKNPILHQLTVNLQPLIVIRKFIIQLLSYLQFRLQGIELILKIILLLDLLIHIADVTLVLVDEFVVFFQYFLVLRVQLHVLVLFCVEFLVQVRLRHE